MITNKLKVIAAITVSIILSPALTFAHPGNTASDGCHYCRTNCSKWGVPWNERHCHGGTTTKKASKPVYVDPCTHTNLLNTYKKKKATGEKMDNLSTKSWWTSCPVEVRKSVFKSVTNP